MSDDIKKSEPIQIPSRNKIETTSTFHIIPKSAGYTKAARQGSKKGLEYIHGEIPVEVWYLGIEMSGGDKDYWRRNNYKQAKAWLAKHPYWKN